MALVGGVPATQLDDQNPIEIRLRALEAETAEIESKLYGVMGFRRGVISKGGELYLNANGLNIINQGGVPVGTWQPDGDVFFGTDVSNPPSGVTIAIFNASQTYNGESVGVGDMLFGNNSTNHANMLWDASAGILYFRGGTTNQVYIDTTGTLNAAGGKIKMGSDGFRIEISTADSPERRILYMDMAHNAQGAAMWAVYDTGGAYPNRLFYSLTASTLSSSAAYTWKEADLILKALDWDRSDFAYVWLSGCHSDAFNHSSVRISPYLILDNLPTSATGLPTGCLWNNSGVINVA